MIFTESQPKYSVLDIGFNKLLVRIAPVQDIADVPPELVNVFTSGVASKSLLAGELLEFVDTGQAGVSGLGDLGSDIRFWAGDTFENRASAPFRVDQDGDSVANDIVINTLTWGRLTGITSFTSKDGFSEKGVGISTITPHFLGTRLRTGAVNGNFAVLYANPTAVAAGVSFSSFTNPLMQVTARVADWGYAEAFLGLTDSTTVWPLTNPVGLDYVGFHLQSNTIYAVSRRAGQGTTSTNIGSGIDNLHTFRFEITATLGGQITSVAFYLDGVLATIHSNQTLLPALMEESDLYFGVRNWNNGGQQDLELTNLLYAQDF